MIRKSPDGIRAQGKEMSEQTATVSSAPAQPAAGPEGNKP